MLEIPAEEGIGGEIEDSQQYTLIALSDVSSVTGTHAGSALRYNVYSPDGKKLLTNAPSLDALAKGTYIINGQKRIIE